jgi:chromosome segregation ATPase
MELRHIDGNIRLAVKECDIDKAASLESRKAVLPAILRQLEENGAELEQQIGAAENALKAAREKFRPLDERANKLKAEQQRIHDEMAKIAQTHLEAMQIVSQAELNLNDLRSKLLQLRGQ